MLAETKEIFLTIEQFCTSNWMVILSCATALALILAIICLIKMSGEKRSGSEWNEVEDMKLSFNIEKAEVNVANLNKEFEDKLTRESAVQDEQKETEPSTGEDSAAPVVIEKLIPIESARIESEEFCRSKSGRVYSEEEIRKRIKD